MAELITDTQLKLRDAGIQMKLAIRNARDDDFFRSCVNAYISTARSITMVMERESAPHPALLVWYKEQTSRLGSTPLFKFFNDQRVHTIHRGVVHPQRGILPMENFEWRQQHDPVRGAIAIGNFTYPHHEEPPVRPGDVINTLSPTEAIFWSFPDAARYFPGGSTNVFRLCEDYFVALKTLVHQWLQRREELGVMAPAG